MCAPIPPLRHLPTAAEVLAQLHITNFQSEHIATLDATQLPYPGYHPDTKNDEIHTDPTKQYLFEREETEDHSAVDDNDVEETEDVSRGCHDALRSYVLDHHLFYILVHDQPKPHGEYTFSELVLLFALGVSPETGHLVGVVSCQVCHNLCD